MGALVLCAWMASAQGTLGWTERPRAGWLLAQAPPTTVISTHDGQVFTGVVEEDLPQGVMLKLPNGSTVFIERAKIKNQAVSVGGSAPPPAGEPPPPVPGDTGPAPITPGTPAPVHTASPALTPETWGKRDPRMMNRIEINDEIRYLVNTRPNPGGAVVMVIVGTLLDLGSIACWIWAGSVAIGIAGGVVGGAVGTFLLVFGIIQTARLGPVRKSMNERIKQLEDQLEHLEDVERAKPSSHLAVPAWIQVARF